MDEICGGYNSNKNIALAHVDFCLTCHYHIDQDWRRNVTYEHNFGGKIFIYPPEKEINGKHMKNIDLHTTECCIVLLAVALTRLQYGITENLPSVAYLT